MTRARQTISVGLLVSSVSCPADALPSSGLGFSASVLICVQLYLALYLQLVPLGPKIQDQIVPVVCNPPSLEQPRGNLHAANGVPISFRSGPWFLSARTSFPNSAGVSTHSTTCPRHTRSL